MIIPSALLLRRLVWCLLAICFVGGLVWWIREQARVAAYDEWIEAAAQEYGVDAPLIAAVIWQESRFRPHVVGGVGEIGLMQVTPTVGYEWAGHHGRMPFDPEELFNPETNIRVGTWYLHRGLQQWDDRPDAVPYALAQYNAGRRNALRWAQNDHRNPHQFVENITFPGTRHYVHTIWQRYRRATDQVAED